MEESMMKADFEEGTEGKAEEKKGNEAAKEGIEHEAETDEGRVISDEEQMMLDMLDEMIAQAEAGNMSMLAAMPGMEGLAGIPDIEGLMDIFGGTSDSDMQDDGFDGDFSLGFSAQKSQDEAAAWAAAIAELTGDESGKFSEEDFLAELEKLSGIIDGDGRESGFTGTSEVDYLADSKLEGLRGMVSDRITKEGWCVGIMFRDPPIEGLEDSGWRFLQGDEDEVYMADYNNHHIFDLNTICNYDPDIVKHLGMSEGTFLIRVSDAEFAEEADLSKLVLKRRSEE